MSSLNPAGGLALMYADTLNAGTSAATGGRPSGMIMDEAGILPQQDLSGWRGLTTQNHLGAVFSANPSAASRLVTMGGRGAGKANALQTLLAAYSDKEVNNTEFEWSLQENMYNSNGERAGGLIWLMDEEEGFDAETGGVYEDSALKHLIMNLNRSKDER